MPLTLTVLGCDGSYAGPGGACSGYLVRGGGVSIWLDAGPGTLANLQRHLDLDELDAVVLSHAHPDHWVDVLPFHNVVRHIRPRTGVAVWSPARVRELHEAVNGEPGPSLDWHVVASGDTARIGGLTLTFSVTDHHVETLAVRIEDADGASLGYSADTGPGWSLSELGPPLDLALCEATLTTDEERRTLHLSGRQAGVSARADATAAFGAPVEIATIDATYQIGT